MIVHHDSPLRRLNNYMRYTQTEERLTATSHSLSYETEICVDEVCRKLFEKRPRTMVESQLAV